MVDSNKLDAIRIAIATKGVRVKGRSIKDSRTPPGRTNATNPSSLGDLDFAYDALKLAQNTKQWDVPNMPQPNKLPIEPHYERIGEAVGSCPYELRRIMETDVTTGNELVVAAFKKLMTAIKISTEIDLREIRKAVVANDQHNATRHRNWEEAVERAEKYNEECNQKISDRKADYYKAWGNILIDLVQKVNRNPNVASLGDWDRFMCYAILNTGTYSYEYASMLNDSITINFDKAKAMPIDMVQNLPILARRYQENERQEKFTEWLEKAPIHQLMDAMTDRHFEHERELIIHAIAYRKGLRAKEDRYGNLQFFDDKMTFEDSEYVEDEDNHWIDERSVREAFLEHLYELDRQRRDYDKYRDRF